MTWEEAHKIALVAAKVDSGCPHCVRGVCEELNAQKFGFVWLPPEEDYGAVGVVELAKGG